MRKEQLLSEVERDSNHGGNTLPPGVGDMNRLRWGGRGRQIDAAFLHDLRSGRQSGLSVALNTMIASGADLRPGSLGLNDTKLGISFCCRPRSVMTPVRKRVRWPAIPYLLDARSLLLLLSSSKHHSSCWVHIQLTDPGESASSCASL